MGCLDNITGSKKWCSLQVRIKKIDEHMAKKVKIINILHHPPPYHSYSNEPRPEINWNTPNGEWVGIWGYDWPDVIGSELLKMTNAFEYEVWQPDLRADKIYTHAFKIGLKHILFPAHEKKIKFGLKTINQVASPRLVNKLEENLSDRLILHLNSLGSCINHEIIERFHNILKIIQFHSKSSPPYVNALKIRKNILANFSYLKLHKELMRNNKISFIYNNSNDVDKLSEYKPIEIQRIFMGCDFNFWIPGDQIKEKSSLGISPGTKVISMASRFNSLKQIDKLIEIIGRVDNTLNNQGNFKLIIAGHGSQEYRDYLEKISYDLIRKEKVQFAGYLNDENLRKLYQASNLFISASISEGGPNSIIKALSCEIPVMCTNVGGVDDILKENNVGIIVEKFNYKDWYRKIINFITGKINVKIMKREKAEEIFHWPNVVRIIKNMYERLLDN